MSWPGPNTGRVYGDVMRLIQAKHDVVMINSVKEFHVRLDGPKDTAYEGGVWKIKVDIPERYPFKSPSIGFVNRIFHPNIDERSGSVCLDVLNQTWTPLYGGMGFLCAHFIYSNADLDLVHVFEVFLPQLLAYPNPNDPLNGEAAQLHLHKRKEFDKKVKTYIQMHALPEYYQSGSKSESKAAPIEGSKNAIESAGSAEKKPDKAEKEVSGHESDLSDMDAGDLISIDGDIFEFEDEPRENGSTPDQSNNESSNVSDMLDKTLTAEEDCMNIETDIRVDDEELRDVREDISCAGAFSAGSPSSP